MLLRLIVLATFATLSAASAAAGNWIAVVAPELRDSLAPLVAQRKSEGWTTRVILAEADITAASQQIAALASDGEPCCVLLVGDFFPDAGACQVPAGDGIHLRMKGKPTDSFWSASAKGAPIETGRLPARNPAELEIMVRKILTWPANRQHQSAFPKVGLITGSHNSPPALERMADGLVNSLGSKLVGQLPTRWRFDGAADVTGSPWQTRPEDLPGISRRMMTTRSTFLAYMGHSALNGAVSRNSLLLSDVEWRALPPDGARPGLFFTCGCHSCELTPRFESFGFAAIRSPGGPPAVIGSHGESWSAMGYLAASGLIAKLAETPAPTRLGSLWLGVRNGLAKGHIDFVTFRILDRVDGTSGKVPLDQQRLEHLESWMLLGDPAMPLIPPVIAIGIDAPTEAVAAAPFSITGDLPEQLANTPVHISIERLPTAVRPAAQGFGKAAAEIPTAIELEIASATVNSEGTRFSASLDLPSPLPPKPWIVRVEINGPSVAAGVRFVK